MTLEERIAFLEAENARLREDLRVMAVRLADASEVIAMNALRRMEVGQ